jgi:C4-dicarboxylate-specific signal transduction histidine kinase
VLVNLLMNADEALADVIETGRTLHVSTGIDPEGIPFVRVADTGHGIAGENLDRIFAHGFTTKQDGHGFGLHSCANSLTEMGGRLTVESGGLGKGAAFTLWFDASRSARAARPSGI